MMSTMTKKNTASKQDKISVKQERFVQNLFSGLSQRDAYVDAYNPGYAISTVDSAASRLANDVKVKARLHELTTQVSDKLVNTKVMSEIERHEILSEIARARFGDFADEDGHLDISGKDRLNNAALAELKTTDWQGGKDSRASSKTTTIRLRDPIAAIAELNKMQRIYETAPRSIEDNRVINILVIDKETKGLIDQVKERTGKLIEGEAKG